jgi:hypothetical protein
MLFVAGARNAGHVVRNTDRYESTKTKKYECCLLPAREMPARVVRNPAVAGRIYEIRKLQKTADRLLPTAPGDTLRVPSGLLITLSFLPNTQFHHNFPSPHC